MFLGDELPPSVTVEPDGSFAHVSSIRFRVDVGEDRAPLEYIIDFRQMGIGDLRTINLYLIKDKEMIQVITPVGAVMAVMAARQWVLRKWVMDRGGNVSLHSYAEEPKRARVYSRMFKELAEALNRRGARKWQVSFDGSHEFIIAKSPKIDRLTRAVGDDRPWQIIS